MAGLDDVLGSTLLTFIGMTVILFGAIAIMMGRALAATWRPYWQAIPYCILLGMSCRFMTFALYDGDLMSISGYVLSTGVLLAFASLSYRVVLAQKMVQQYPWLFASSGLFNWRQKEER